MPFPVAESERVITTGKVEFHGYSDCIRIENEVARVTLGHHCGGRVLEYSRDGENVLYLDPDQAGWTPAPGASEIDPWGGRFDIGPEVTLPAHPALWLGPWSAEVDSAGAARLISLADTATGAQLIREFRLDPVSSRLSCTQTIVNVSAEERALYHWSRTIAKGGGICVIPVTSPSRFPNGYVMYGPGATIDYRPADPNIRVRDGFLEILDTPRYPKLCMDTGTDWFAYLLPSNWLFVKRYRSYRDRRYTDITGATVSIWYNEDRQCELEPIGPEERLQPGQSASFREDWWILPYRFPERRDTLDLKAIADLVRLETQLPD
jgi:hypothetical protein